MTTKNANGIYAWGAGMVFIGMLISWFGVVQAMGLGVAEATHGVLLGTLFGQVSIASFWAAIGAAPLSLRLATAAAWVLCLVLPRAVAMALAGNGLGIACDWIVLVVMQGAVFYCAARVLLNVFPFAVLFGDEVLRRPACVFTIRDLCVIVAAISIFLGATSYLIQSRQEDGYTQAYVTSVMYSCITILVFSIPACIASLLVCARPVAMLIAVLWIGAGGAVTLLVLDSRIDSEYVIPTSNEMNAANSIACLWIVCFAWIARQYGYRIALSGREAGSLSTAQQPYHVQRR